MSHWPAHLWTQWQKGPPYAFWQNSAERDSMGSLFAFYLTFTAIILTIYGASPACQGRGGQYKDKRKVLLWSCLPAAGGDAAHPQRLSGKRARCSAEEGCPGCRAVLSPREPGEERGSKGCRGREGHDHSTQRPWGETVSNGSLFVGCREGFKLRLGCWVMEGSESHGEDGGRQK